MRALILLSILFASVKANDVGLLTDLVCNHDTTKSAYIVNDGEQSGWRVVQILKPYIVIRYWNYDRWYDCYPCLVKAKESFWTSGEWKALKRMDWVPEMELKWYGIVEVILEDGFHSDLPVVKK